MEKYLEIITILEALIRLLEVVPAITEIFNLGFLPSEDDFYGLTPEQSEGLCTQVRQADERVFILLPKNPAFKFSLRNILVVTEYQISWFKKAGKLIEEYCRKSGQTFNTFEEKLAYCATVMPSELSAESKFRRESLHEA
jgi:hypothetical protein